MKSDVSVICCYTSSEKLSYLSSSLDEQTYACERVFIDNGNGEFSSAAAALNYGARKATGELLLFCHQDVRFTNEHSLEDLVRRCGVLEPGDVGGVAGAIRNGCGMLTKTNITHSYEELRYNQKDWFDAPYIVVESVDECVIILRRSTWEMAPFNEVVCDGWHLYGVERCLRARASGYRALTFDARVNHLSEKGGIDASFFRCLRKLVENYKDDFDAIIATTGYWSCKHLEISILRYRFRVLREPFVKRVISMCS